MGFSTQKATAYQRQACVRLTLEIPEIKEKIDQGRLSVSSVTAVFKHIRKKPIEDKLKALKKIEHKSTREVKKLFLEPMKTIKVKKTEYQDKVYLRLELTHEQNKKLEKLRALQSHKHSDLEGLFLNLIDKELSHFEKTDFKATKSKNPRQISKRLRNHALKKSNYSCQYPGCESDHLLQIDHIIPVRVGGNQRPDNLQVLCES